MQIGSMTNPYKPLLPQIHWIGTHGFDYVDLALEPPRSWVPDIDGQVVKKTAAQYNMEIVVHTSPYLPVVSRHPAMRQAAWAELRQSVAMAKELGSALVTIHYLGAPAFYATRKIIDTYTNLLNFLIQAAEQSDVRVAIENSPTNRNEVSIFREIFRQVPDARLLLDVGHTHLNADGNRAGDFLNDPILGSRLVHVHASDNNGLDDLHLPPGSVRNSIDWQEMVRMLHNHPYDGRITLEVFSPDPEYLLLSRKKLMQWWEAAGR